MQNFTLSLDVWNTLVTANPEYNKHRIEQLHKILGVSRDRIQSTYNQFKQDADNFAETGRCLSRQVMYTNFIRSFELDAEKIKWYDVANVVDDSFVKHPPFIHPELTSVLSGFSKRMDVVYGVNAYIGISTNNNFVSSDAIDRAVLRHLQTIFAFHLSSTDLECAKPSIKFIQHIKEKAPTNRIIHVGDNPICDNFGDLVHKSIIINNPAHCISVLKGEF